MMQYLLCSHIFFPLPLSQSGKMRRKVSVIPSPDQIPFFNPRLWTFGLASRSGPGAQGWWAHRATFCWAGQFFWSRQIGGSSKNSSDLHSPSICCSRSATQTAWCKGLRLWMGLLGNLFWLTQWVCGSFFLSLERSLCCSLFATFWLICIDCHSLPFTKHLWHNSIPSTKEYNMHVHSRLFENGPKKIKSIFIHNRFDLKDLPLTLSEETACGPLPPHLL